MHDAESPIFSSAARTDGVGVAGSPGGGGSHSRTAGTERRFRLALILTAVVLLIEAGAGWRAGSLALLADAGHILTDILALSLAWFAVRQADKPPDDRRTYGYHRVGILTATVNGAGLVLIVGAIFVSAVSRLQHPQPVAGSVVVVAALAAAALNAFVVLQLRHAGDDLNTRAARLHVMGDLLGSAAVVVAGLVIVSTGWNVVDPLLSGLIAVLIAVSAVRILGEALQLLLEGTPRGVDVAAVRSALTAVPGVDSIHDLHVWGLSADHLALSCHVVVSTVALADAELTVRRAERVLCDQFNIAHTTLQLESSSACIAEMHGAHEHNHPHPTL